MSVASTYTTHRDGGYSPNGGQPAMPTENSPSYYQQTSRTPDSARQPTQEEVAPNNYTAARPTFLRRSSASSSASSASNYSTGPGSYAARADGSDSMLALKSKKSMVVEAEREQRGQTLAGSSSELNSMGPSGPAHAPTTPQQQHVRRVLTKRRSKRKSAEAVSGADNRRLAIVEVDAPPPTASPTASRRLSFVSVGGSSKPGMASKPMSPTSRAPPPGSIALVAPPDASPRAYTDLTPPTSAPATGSQRFATDKTPHTKHHHHTASEAPPSALTIDPSTGKNSLGHRKNSSSRDVGIVGMTPSPSHTSYSLPSAGSTTSDKSSPIFQMPWPESTTSAETPLSPSLPHTLIVPPTPRDFGNLSPISPSPEVLTPNIGESKEVHDPVAGPVVVGIHPDRIWPIRNDSTYSNGTASQYSSHAPSPLGTPLSEPPGAAAAAAVNIHKPPPPGIQDLAMMELPPVYPNPANPLPPPPRFIVPPSALGASPPPPRPPRMHSPPPPGSSPLPKRSDARGQLYMPERGTALSPPQLMQRTDSDFSITAVSVSSGEDPAKPAVSPAPSQGGGEHKRQGSRPSHVREGAFTNTLYVHGNTPIADALKAQAQANRSRSPSPTRNPETSSNTSPDSLSSAIEEAISDSIQPPPRMSSLAIPTNLNSETDEDATNCDSNLSPDVSTSDINRKASWVSLKDGGERANTATTSSEEGGRDSMEGSSHYSHQPTRSPLQTARPFQPPPTQTTPTRKTVKSSLKPSKPLINLKRFSSLPKPPSEGSGRPSGEHSRSSREPSPSPPSRSRPPLPVPPPMPRAPFVRDRQRSPWPEAMATPKAIIKKRRPGWERAVVYANKINELAMYECGLNDWIAMMRFRATLPRDPSKRANMLTPESGGPAGPGSSPFAPKSRHSSRDSNATFPRRADAYLATDLTYRYLPDDTPPPELPPSLPYPSLAPRSNSSTPPSSVRHLHPANGIKPGGGAGGFFASIGRKTSIRRERSAGGGGFGTTSLPVGVVDTSSPHKHAGNTRTLLGPDRGGGANNDRQPHPRPIDIQKSPSLVGGPRSAPTREMRARSVMPPPVESRLDEADRTRLMRQPSVPDLPSASVARSAIASPTFGSAQPQSPTSTRLVKAQAQAQQQAFVAATHPPPTHDPAFEQQLDQLTDLLPQASRAVLAGYLRRAGQDIVAIGRYLEDEKNGVVIPA